MRECTGNGYLFLELLKVSNDPKHLWRAWKFAEFATSPEAYVMPTLLAADQQRTSG
jgi:ABC-type glycerol-3-phosphate transport system substrate-binding protein